MNIFVSFVVVNIKFTDLVVASNSYKSCVNIVSSRFTSLRQCLHVLAFSAASTVRIANVIR